MKSNFVSGILNVLYLVIFLFPRGYVMKFNFDGDNGHSSNIKNVIASMKSEEFLHTNTLYLSITPQDYFAQSSVCVNTYGDITIRNMHSDRTIRVSSVSTSDSQFIPKDFSPAYLSPSNSMTFSLSYLPVSIGRHDAVLVISTSDGDVEYFLYGEGHENSYGIAPLEFNIVESVSKSTEQFPIIIYNPHSEIMRIMDVSSSNEYVSLNSIPLSRISMWEILPGDKIEIISYTLRNDVIGFRSGFIDIKTSINEISIPIEVSVVEGGLIAVPDLLSFGTLLSAGQRSVELRLMNTGKINVLITDLQIEPRDPHMEIQAYSMPMLIPAGNESTTYLAATITYYSNEPSKIDGHVIITTNSSDMERSILRVPYVGSVLHGGVGFDVPSTIFYIPTELPLGRTNNVIDDKHYSRLIYLKNHFNGPIFLDTLHLQGCHEYMTIVHYKRGVVAFPLSYWPGVLISINVEAAMRDSHRILPFKCAVEMRTNISSHKIPLHIMNGTLQITYLNEKSIGQGIDIFDRVVDRIDMGTIYKDESKPLLLVATNPNPVSSKLTWGLCTGNIPCCVCFEASWPSDNQKIKLVKSQQLTSIMSARTLASSYADKSSCTCSNSSMDNEHSKASRLFEIYPKYSNLYSIVFSNSSREAKMCDTIHSVSTESVDSMSSTSAYCSISFHINTTNHHSVTSVKYKSLPYKSCMTTRSGTGSGSHRIKFTNMAVIGQQRSFDLRIFYDDMKSQDYASEKEYEHMFNPSCDQSTTITKVHIANDTLFTFEVNSVGIQSGKENRSIYEIWHGTVIPRGNWEGLQHKSFWQQSLHILRMMNATNARNDENHSCSNESDSAGNNTESCQSNAFNSNTASSTPSIKPSGRPSTRPSGRPSGRPSSNRTISTTSRNNNRVYSNKYDELVQKLQRMELPSVAIQSWQQAVSGLNPNPYIHPNPTALAQYQMLISVYMLALKEIKSLWKHVYPNGMNVSTTVNVHVYDQLSTHTIQSHTTLVSPLNVFPDAYHHSIHPRSTNEVFYLFVEVSNPFIQPISVSLSADDILSPNTNAISQTENDKNIFESMAESVQTYMKSMFSKMFSGSELSDDDKDDMLEHTRTVIENSPLEAIFSKELYDEWYRNVDCQDTPLYLPPAYIRPWGQDGMNACLRSKHLHFNTSGHANDMLYAKKTVNSTSHLIVQAMHEFSTSDPVLLNRIHNDLSKYNPTLLSHTNTMYTLLSNCDSKSIVEPYLGCSSTVTLQPGATTILGPIVVIPGGSRNMHSKAEDISLHNSILNNIKQKFQEKTNTHQSKTIPTVFEIEGYSSRLHIPVMNNYTGLDFIHVDQVYKLPKVHIDHIRIFAYNDTTKEKLVRASYDITDDILSYNKKLLLASVYNKDTVYMNTFKNHYIVTNIPKDSIVKSSGNVIVSDVQAYEDVHVVYKNTGVEDKDIIIYDAIYNGVSCSSYSYKYSIFSKRISICSQLPIVIPPSEYKDLLIYHHIPCVLTENIVYLDLFLTTSDHYHSTNAMDTSSKYIERNIFVMKQTNENINQCISSPYSQVLYMKNVYLYVVYNSIAVLLLVYCMSRCFHIVWEVYRQMYKDIYGKDSRFVVRIHKLFHSIVSLSHNQNSNSMTQTGVRNTAMRTPEKKIVVSNPPQEYTSPDKSMEKLQQQQQQEEQYHEEKNIGNDNNSSSNGEENSSLLPTTSNRANNMVTPIKSVSSRTNLALDWQSPINVPPTSTIATTATTTISSTTSVTAEVVNIEITTITTLQLSDSVYDEKLFISSDSIDDMLPFVDTSNSLDSEIVSTNTTISASTTSSLGSANDKESQWKIMNSPPRSTQKSFPVKSSIAAVDNKNVASSSGTFPSTQQHEHILGPSRFSGTLSPPTSPRKNTAPTSPRMRSDEWVRGQRVPESQSASKFPLDASGTFLSAPSTSTATTTKTNKSNATLPPPPGLTIRPTAVLSNNTKVSTKEAAVDMYPSPSSLSFSGGNRLSESNHENSASSYVSYLTSSSSNDSQIDALLNKIASPSSSGSEIVKDHIFSYDNSGILGSASDLSDADIAAILGDNNLSVSSLHGITDALGKSNTSNTNSRFHNTEGSYQNLAFSHMSPSHASISDPVFPFSSMQHQNLVSSSSTSGISIATTMSPSLMTVSATNQATHSTSSEAVNKNNTRPISDDKSGVLPEDPVMSEWLSAVLSEYL